MAESLASSGMHKDAPPGLLERPVGVVVTYGLVTGFVAGALVFAGWSFFSSMAAKESKTPPPLPLLQQRP